MHHCSIHHQNVKAEAIHIQAHDVSKGNEDVGVSAVYAIEISTKTKHEKCTITALEFMYEQAKD